MLTTLLNRIGNLGLLLIACALLLGGLAGAAVAHHYDRPAADTISAPHGDGKANGAQKPKHQNGNQKPPNNGHQGGNPTSVPAQTD